MTRKRKSSAPHKKVPLNRKAAIKPVEANPNSQFYFLTAHKDQRLVYIYMYI